VVGRRPWRCALGGSGRQGGPPAAPGRGRCAEEGRGGGGDDGWDGLDLSKGKEEGGEEGEEIEGMEMMRVFGARAE